MVTVAANARELTLLSEAHLKLQALFSAFCAAHDLPDEALFYGVSRDGVLVQLPTEAPIAPDA